MNSNFSSGTRPAHSRSPARYCARSFRSPRARRGPDAVLIDALAANLAGQTTSWVVVSVSQAIRASGSFDRNKSTIESEIWSDTLSGWPSETLSEVNR